MKILIYGVGGVGGFIGSHLQKTGFDISYIARGTRFEFLKKNGLKLKSQLGDKSIKKIKIFNTIPNKIDFDVIISTVKLYDFDGFIEEIKKKGLHDTILLPFQNGVYSEQKITQEFGEEKTFGAVAQISSFINENQYVIHKGKLASFFVGNMSDIVNKKLLKFCEISKNSGLDIQYKSNIKEKIWEKFIFLSAYSGITTLTKKSIGEIFASTALKDNFVNAMIETYNLSKFFNVKFKVNPVDYWLEKIKKMPFDMTSSMYLDYLNNKQLELKWLSGFIVECSKKFDNKCETHQSILNDIVTK